MGQNKNYIIPMSFVLDKHIERNIHFLRLPKQLKEKLFRLEELSKNGKNGAGMFIREKHNLPLNTLKRLFMSFLPGVTDMKAVSQKTTDERWLVGTEEIDVERVVRIIHIWIEAFYIAETELERPRKNGNQVKEFARQVISELDETWFEDCDYDEQVVLFDRGKVVDKDAYSLLPFLAVDALTGTELSVAGMPAVWMYSKKNEIVTDPMTYKGRPDAFSFAAAFSVQTIPPYNEPFLNVKVSSRRWVSRNRSEKVPYYKDQKSVYMRVDDRKLQQLHAKYSPEKKTLAWIYTDEKLLSGLYGKENKPEFKDIILHPDRFMRGVDEQDYYIAFEYGMLDGSRQMHSQNAGISPADRRAVFEDIEQKLKDYSSGAEPAYKLLGNTTIVEPYFEADMHIQEKMQPQFLANVNAICKGAPIAIEICYSAGQELLRDGLKELLQMHFAETAVSCEVIAIDGLAAGLDCENMNANRNLAGYNKRIDEVKQQLGQVRIRTLSIVIIHEPDWYRIDDKPDGRVDPKTALRVGFAKTGRLTQFVTYEHYQQTETDRRTKIETAADARNKDGSLKKTYACNQVLKSTILDAYRQLGIHNCLTGAKGKTTLTQKIAVGIHVVNYKNLITNDLPIAPFPLIVMCDLAQHEIRVETEMKVMERRGSNVVSVKRIACPYLEFPVRFRELVDGCSKNQRLTASEGFLQRWFERLEPASAHEIMIVADGTSRKLVEGITNKEIKELYDETSGNVKRLTINETLNQAVDLDTLGQMDLIRLRINDEVPDYLLCTAEGGLKCAVDEESGDEKLKDGESKDEKLKDEKSKGAESDYEESAGVYQYKDVYYSKEVRPARENNNKKQSLTKLETNGAMSHRNIIEIYPMYIHDRQQEQACVAEIHNLRSASLQYEAGKTILPLPLHLAKLLEEYMV